MSRLTLNSNIASLRAQRSLAAHTSALADISERLSTGLRINRASDDAAGLAVASGLEADRRVYAQAVRNVQEGISYLGVAEGATRALQALLISLKELAQQSANGVMSDSSRQTLQSEASALEVEYNRIIDSSSYNGRQVFALAERVLTVQAGYGVEGAIEAVLGVEGEGGGEASLVEIERVSVHSSGAEGDNHSISASISADGRYVAFVSSASNLVDGDTNGTGDVFVHDRQTGETTRVSVHSSGAEVFRNRPHGASIGSRVHFLHRFPAANIEPEVLDVRCSPDRTGATSCAVQEKGQVCAIMMADRELPQGATSGCQVVDDAKSADRGTGASILELALVLPALVIILLGLIEFATAFYTYPILLEGARSGAHSAAKLNPGGANPGQLIRDTAVEAACSYIGDAGLSATGYRVTVRRDWLGGRRAVRVTVERPENSWTIFALMLRHYQASVVFRLRTAIGPAPGVSTTECS